MRIERGLPAEPASKARRATPRNRSYKELFDRLSESPKDWLRVHPNDVSGNSIRRKQTRLGNAATDRKMAIQTTVQDGYIYVRFLQPRQESA